ncbi:minor capsid protein [Streptococcus iners]|uniref:Minor capsid protein n=1 Tax=Streptococcus iners TaxID=3028084 RepID=A0AA96VLE1_9STRE|nr:minor capsid protein [Streptococcus sp. 29887]MCK4025906.1 minor capsid protein [Streptococcus suis]WNY51641.1 minor capsid protein [Streptococcus sp. 29887]
MTKNHNDYWQKRVDDIFKHQDMTDEAFFKELSQIYSEASLSLQKDLFEFYNKYAEDNQISLAEARQRLIREDLSNYRANVERYRKQAEKDPELLRRINEQYMSSMASRMDVLNMEIVYKMGVLKGLLDKSFESYLKSSAEYAYRKAMGGRSGTLNDPALREVIRTPFEAKNYSEQLWGHVDNLARDLKEALKRGFVHGEHPRVLAKELAKKYTVAKHRAETLIRTDGTAVVNAATARRYMDAGLEYYRILVHMDNRTTEICRRIHAEDKRYRLDEMKVGLNAPPFHFNCRSGIVPDEEELGIEREYMKEFNTYEDPIREFMGSAFESHPEDSKRVIESLEKIGVEVVFGESPNMTYQGSPVLGNPGRIYINKEASYSALVHEATHANDDYSRGWTASRDVWDKDLAVWYETRAYDAEIALNKLLKVPESYIIRLEKLKEEAIKSILERGY